MNKNTNLDSNKICLAFVYNNRFDDNIKKLEVIYGKRFSNIYHLVPFYDGDKENVIPVFEHSFYFQGYFPQAFSKLKQKDFDYYIFIGDDLILNPSLNENNIISELNLNNKTSFLAEFWGMLNERSFQWANFFPVLNAFYQQESLLHHEVNWKNELPEIEYAKKKFHNNSLKFGKITHKNLKFKHEKYSFTKLGKGIKEYINLILKRRRSLPYPILTGYSDFIIVPKESMYSFIGICETFRKMRLWVEAAIPTALILSSEKVISFKDTKFETTTYWIDKNFHELKERSEACNFEFEKLLLDFKENELLIHPIKLSQWKINV